MQSQPLRGAGLTVGPSLRAVGSAPEAGPEASSHFLPRIFLPSCPSERVRSWQADGKSWAGLAVGGALRPDSLVLVLCRGMKLLPQSDRQSGVAPPRCPGHSITSTLMPVYPRLSLVEILKRAVDRPMDPTRNSHRKTHRPAVWLNLDIRSEKRGAGE